MICGDTSFCEFSSNVLNVICTGRIRRGEIKRVGGVRVDMNRTLFMHVVSEGKHKESNVRGSTSFINVKPSNVRVVVDVV